MELIITALVVILLLVIWFYEETRRKNDILLKETDKIFKGREKLLAISNNWNGAWFKKYTLELQKNDRQRDKISELNRKIVGLNKLKNKQNGKIN